MPHLAATAVLASSEGARPPLVLVHGAANSALVWTFWQREWAAHGWSSYALDLRGHGGSSPGDLSASTMEDYAADVLVLTQQLARRPVLMGWSMGGLVAMMAAAAAHAVACIALAPSMPALTVNEQAPLRPGEFGPEEYGITHRDPHDQPAMPDLDLEERAIALRSLGRESRWARDQRQRGIVIAELPCPLLLLTGERDEQWPAARYAGLWLPADRIIVEGASHWGLVLNRRALAAALPDVLRWLERHAATER